ncbi:MAG TPA: hypothetical protein VN905_14735 [Candidatus Binatia bacterium]|nr:hypothetical protein [Candidatus Binatia bacterium]
MNAPARGPQRFTVDPREVVNLYHRCVRCLFVRVRENDTRRVWSTALEAADKFYALAASWMEGAQAKRSWQDFGGTRFRVLSQGRTVVSEPISFPDVNIELVFSSRSDAIIELEDGSTSLAAYQIAVPVERRQRQRDLELEAEAFAVEHPFEKGAAESISHLGHLEFLVTGTIESNTCVVLGASRLTLLARRPKQMKDFMRVVAGILAARIAPPADRFCEFCKRSAVKK